MHVLLVIDVLYNSNLWSQYMSNVIFFNVIFHARRSRNGGVVVASYYLPVIISKSEKGEWSAQWDREQILSLQVDGTSVDKPL